MRNLSEIADKLNKTAEDIRLYPDMSEVRISLKNQALHLLSYQEYLVEPMTAQTIEMRELAKNIDRTLKFNRTSFEVAMNELREEVMQAEQYIKVNGTEFVREVC